MLPANTYHVQYSGILESTVISILRPEPEEDNKSIERDAGRGDQDVEGQERHLLWRGGWGELEPETRDNLHQWPISSSNNVLHISKAKQEINNHYLQCFFDLFKPSMKVMENSHYYLKSGSP